MKTYTGRTVDPLNLRPEDIDIRDIAHHLSNSARFNGATRFFYSNAQHSVYVLHDVMYTLAVSHMRGEKPPSIPAWELQLKALLHDATDAYYPDVPTPLKHSRGYGFEAFRECESKALDAVYERFGLSPGVPDEVHKADDRVKVVEGIELMQHRYAFALPSEAVLNIEKLSPEAAEAFFLNAYAMLISRDDFRGTN